jgi:hypothetical protein
MESATVADSLLPTSKTVPRVSADELSYEQFHERYFLPGNPVIITGSYFIKSIREFFQSGR